MTRQLLQEELLHALQESDTRRELDSLEMVVVTTRLSGHGIAPPAGRADYPKTVEGWLEWADRSLNAS